MSKKVLIVMLFALGILLYTTTLWADDDAIMDVDNHSAAFTGSWGYSTNKLLYYGDDYRYAWGAGAGVIIPTRVATFTTAKTAKITGDYAVYVRWTSASNREETVVFEIYDGSTYEKKCLVNQTVNGGEWRYCNTISLTAGNHGVVKLGNEGCDTNEVVIADGVRFVRVSKDSDDITNETGGDFASGDLYEEVTDTDEIVKFVSITVPPGGGKVIVNASGCFHHRNSVTIDDGRCSITTGSALDYSHLIIADENGVNTKNYTPFAATRGYDVSEGTTTFNLVCDRISGTIYIVDASMTAIFVPTTY